MHTIILWLYHIRLRGIHVQRRRIPKFLRSLQNLSIMCMSRLHNKNKSAKLLNNVFYILEKKNDFLEHTIPCKAFFLLNSPFLRRLTFPFFI
jgi:hypothetical protein